MTAEKLCRWGWARAAVVAVFVVAMLLLGRPALASPSAVGAPVGVARVAWGTIGYRSVGHGRPLVLLMGGGSQPFSIDHWPPSLIDALARNHRVLAIDHEGVGSTTLRPGVMTITRLADDTAAFIAALHLKRPDVLGWSMGGFVAQALAVRHPDSVRRIILCASAPGDGHGIGNQVGSPPYPGAYLFPPGPQNAARAQAFERSIQQYPGYYEGSQQVGFLQANAINRWLDGSDRAGHRLKRLRTAALIGDGLQDQIAPVANSRMLAAAIPHAQLKIYRDAAHGFFIQHLHDWVRRVDRFLR